MNDSAVLPPSVPAAAAGESPILVSDRKSRAASAGDPQIREYWTRGYLVLRGLFRPEEVAGWSAEADRLLQLDLVHPDNLRTPFRMNSGNLPERIDPVVDISPVFRALTQDSRVQDVVRGIFEDEPLLFKDKLIFKAPGTDGYAMHQDQAWWQLCAADDILSVSFQIDGASAANGCIELFPGHHDRLLTPAGKQTNLDEALDLVDASCGEKVETQPGDVLVFHSLAPHQSGTNTANVSRRSLYLTYSAARAGDQYERQLSNYRFRSTTPSQYFR